MTIPFFLLGPNKHRHYSIDNRRWQEFSDQHDDYSVGLKTRYGLRMSIVIFSIALFLVGATVSILVGSIMEFPSFQLVGTLSSLLAGTGCFYIPFKDASLSKQYPPIVIGRKDNGEIWVNSAKLDVDKHSKLLLRLTIYRASGAQGSSSYSDLDLIAFQNNAETKFELIAHQNEWCRRHFDNLQQLLEVPGETRSA